MPPTPAPEMALLKACEGALREGLLLDEALGGMLDAALQFFDAAATSLLPAGGAPPLSRCGRSLLAAAAEQRLTQHLTDVLTQGRVMRVVDSGITFIGVPVKVADQVRGVFGLAIGQTTFRSDPEEAVRVFARCIAHILEREKTLSTLMKRREEAVALFELASGALHSLNAEEVIRLTVASLSRELDFDRVTAYRFDAENRDVEEIQSQSAPTAAPARKRLDEMELLGRCLAAHGPAFDDAADSSGGVGPARRRQLALPLQAGETVFGFLTMSRRGSFVLTPQEMRLAQELAKLAAGALEKARLIEVDRRTTERIAFVSRLHSTLSGLTEVGAILQRAVDEAGPYFDVDLCAVRLLPAGELPGATGAYVRTGSGTLGAGEVIPDALLQHLSAEGAHVLLADAFGHPQGLTLLPAPSFVKGLARPLSLLAVPLSYRGEIVGALAAVTGGRAAAFTPPVLRSFEALAVELSLALTSARMLQKERDSYRFLDRLHEVGRSLNTTFDAPRIKQSVCEQAVALFKSDAAHYWDADPQSKSLQITARWGADVGGDLGRSVPTDRTAHPIVKGFLDKTIHVASDEQVADFFPGAPVPSGPPLARAVVMPLVYQDALVGLLSLVNRRGSDAWPHDLPGRLSLLADAAAVALHNARLVKIVEQQTERDGQTGLSNRAAILRRLEAEVRRAERSNHSIAIAHVKMEGLLEINAQLGQGYADALLPRAAAHLVRATRAVNVVGRDRGDRFWILIFDADKATAQKAAEAIQKNFEGTFDPKLTQAGLSLGLTFGIAAYPEDAFDTPSLVSRAEEALDDAVKVGRGTIVLYGALSAADA